MAQIWTLLKLLPELFALGKTLYNLLKQGVDILHIKKKMGEMNDALNKAAASKDTSDLESIFRPKP